MYFLKTVIIAILLIAISAHPAAAKLFNAQNFKLDNGLQVIIIPNHKAPVVTQMIWYKVGGADEPKGKSGITHFLEHLMFKGTSLFPDGVFSSTVRKLGGNDNAFTSHDYTAYYQNVPKANLEKVMEMEADRMKHLKLTPDDVKHELQVVMEERKQRIDNNPQALFQERLMQSAYVNHPYGTPVIGWMNEVRNLTRNDALESYGKWYAPNNAVLIIAGDISAAEAKPLAEKYYGSIPPALSISGKRERPEAEALVTYNHITMRDDKVGNPVIRLVYRADRGDIPLAMAADALGGSSSSRLYKKLVVEEKKAVTISVNYDPVSLDDTVLIINAVPAPKVTVTELHQLLDKEIIDFMKSGITEDELKSAKDKMLADAIFYLDSLQGPALFFGRYIASGFNINYIENLDRKVEKISQDDADSSLRRTLQRIPVTGYLLPNEEGDKK